MAYVHFQKKNKPKSAAGNDSAKPSKTDLTSY